MKILGPVLLALLAFATNAQATTVVGPPQYQEWANEARVPTPDETVVVTVSETACAGALGCSLPGEIGLSTLAPWRSVFLHELGHNFDAMYMTEEDHSTFLALIHHSDFSWWSNSEEDYSYDRMGGEWFADSYMQCARLPHIKPQTLYSIGSGVVRGYTLRKVCALIRETA